MSDNRKEFEKWWNEVNPEPNRTKRVQYTDAYTCFISGYKSATEQSSKEIERLNALVSMQAEALKPFAALLQDHNCNGQSNQPIFAINDAMITRGDLRNANASIEASSSTVAKWEAEKLLPLQQKIAALEALRPNWAEGLSDDSVAAQCNGAALAALWKILQVTNQTDAVAKLQEMLPLQRQVAMLHEDAIRWRKLVALAWHYPAPLETASQRGGRGLFVEYEGSGVTCWSIQLRDETLSTFVDNQTVPIDDNTQATAEAYDRELAAKVLEDYANWLRKQGMYLLPSTFECAEGLERRAAELRATKVKE